MNSKKENLWSKVSTFLVFAGPATFSFLAVVIVPFLYGVYLTFTSWDGVSSNKPFVGLKKLCGSSCRQQLLAVPGTDTAVCGSFRNTGKRGRIFTGTAGNRKN